MDIEKLDTPDLTLYSGESGEVPKFTKVEGGHFHYLKHIVEIDEQRFFLKSFAPEKFTDELKREHSLAYLRKEYQVMRFLADADYPYIPAFVEWDEDKQALVEEAFPQDENWHWELPEGELEQNQYLEDVLMALGAQPAADYRFEAISSHNSLQEYYDLGWTVLEHKNARKQAQERLNGFREAFLPHVQSGVELLERILTNTSLSQHFQAMATQHLWTPRSVIAHYDARQSNIAWHPELGARIVDWSWAAPGPANGDQTMFIIDLFKSGKDVTDYTAGNFDPNHAAMLIGLWLGRSSAPTADGNTEVRFHQLASAASAATLLN
jgi:hypothetical protein